MTGVGLLFRVVASLGVVIVLMWIAARMMRARGLTGTAPRKGTKGARLEVLDRRSLSKNSALALVRVGGQTVLIGVTDHNITALSQVDPLWTDVELVEIDANGPASTDERPNADPLQPNVDSGTAWKMLVSQLRERTVRKA